MSDGNSLEVAEFLEHIARNWFIRNSLMIAAFGGLGNGIFTFTIYIFGVWHSSVAMWTIALVSFFTFVFSIFLAGIHYIVSRMYMQLLGRDFNYLCQPAEYRDRSGA